MIEKHPFERNGAIMYILIILFKVSPEYVYSKLNTLQLNEVFHPFIHSFILFNGRQPN